MTHLPTQEKYQINERGLDSSRKPRCNLVGRSMARGVARECGRDPRGAAMRSTMPKMPKTPV